MNNKLTLVLTLCASAIFVGCAGTQNKINPGNLSMALSQDNANDDLTVASPYGNLAVHRTVPAAKDTTPVTQLTPAQLAAVNADPIASFVYGLGRDSASVNLTWQGVGGTVVFERSMPPSTNATINVNVVNTTSNPVPSVVTPAK